MLQTLSESERKEFDNYLKAPIGRRPRVSNKIIDAFLKSDNFENFMNENYNKRSKWNTYSELTLTLEDFLTAKRMLKDIEIRNELLSDEFTSRGLTDLSKAYFEKEISNLTSSKPDDRILMKSLHLQEKYIELLRSIGEIKRFKENLDMRYEIFAVKSVFESLLFQLEYRNNSNDSKDIRLELFNSYIGSFDMKKIIQLTKEKAPRFYQLLNMAHKILNLYTKPQSLSNFENVRDYFYANMDSFTKDFKVKIYYMLINYLINLGNSGLAKTDNYLFELLRKKIGEGLTDDLEYSNLDRGHFRDYVVIALRVNELTWANEFIENYSSLLSPSEKENELNVVRAMLSLKKRDFVSAIKFIEKVKRSDYIYITDYFRISIISRFELHEFLECMKQIKSFKRYLWRNSEIPEVYVNKYKSFLRFIEDLVEFKQTGNSGDLEGILNEIKKDTSIPSHTWMIEKAQELLKPRKRSSIKQ